MGIFDRIAEKLDSMLEGGEEPVVAAPTLTSTQQRLQRTVQQRLMATGAFETVATLGGSFGLLARRPGSGAVQKLQLDNLLCQVARANAAEQEAAIDAFVSMALGGDQPRATGAGDFNRALRTILRPASKLCEPALMEALDAVFVWRPVSELLVELLALDGPSIRIVSPERLEQAGMSVEQAFAQARANVAATGAPADRPWPGHEAILHASVDNYETSRVLVDAWVAANTAHFGGEPLFCMPTAEALFAVSETDTNAIVEVLEACRNHYDEAASPISPALYRRDGGQLVAWIPQPRHPAWSLQTMALTLERAHSYEDQKEPLQAQLAEEGYEEFVASVEALRDEPTSTAYTRSIWPRPLTTWLPRTDAVALVNGDQPTDETILVSWRAIEEEVGHLLEPVDHYGPRRYRTLGWSTSWQRCALGRVRRAGPKRGGRRCR